MAIVTFNYANWIATYPEFSAIPEGTVVGAYLPLATVYCPIDGTSPIVSCTLLQAALNAMVAHVTYLLGGANGQPPSPLVGRISAAAEGTVNVAVEMPMTPSNAWFMQSKYGAFYWAMMAPYRTMRYLPSLRRRSFSPWRYG